MVIVQCVEKNKKGKHKKSSIINNFHKLQNMHFYCKNCKKHTGNTFPKTLVLISKNKIKGKSKRAICLAERTFIDKIEDIYDSES